MSIPVGSALPTGPAPEEPGPEALAPPGSAGSAKKRRLPRLGVGGWISVAIIVLAVLLAIFGPLVRPYDPNEVSLSYANVGPMGGHLLGFDGAGRDLLSRLMVGARTTLLGAALVSIVAVTIGSSLAVLTAWFGGRFDTAVSSGLDVMFAFPGILLAVLAAAVFGPGLLAAGLALAMAYSPYLARVLRGAALKERAMAYIQAGEVQGFSSWWLCFRHLLPNISSLIVAQGTDLLRLRRGRPGGAVLPRARHPATPCGLGRDGLGRQDPAVAGVPARGHLGRRLHRARGVGGELPGRAAPGAVH